MIPPLIVAKALSINSSKKLLEFTNKPKPEGHKLGFLMEA
jgi:hypothetical protein